MSNPSRGGISPTILLLLLALLPPPRPALAAGFALFEQGAAAMGRGGAFCAGASDPSALFYNPAGLARLEGAHLLLSPSLVLFSDRFEGALPYPGPRSTASTGTRAFPLPSAYWAHGIGRRGAIALGLLAPFGLETNWTGEPEFAGRFLAARSRIERLELTAGGALRAGESSSLGASIGMTRTRVRLERALAAPYDGLDRTLEVGMLVFDAVHWGDVAWSAGGMTRLGQGLGLGLSYRSGGPGRLRGPASFEYIDFTTGNEVQDSVLRSILPADQSARLDFRLPWTAIAGAEWRRADGRLRLEADVVWAGWSRFDRLTLGFTRDTALDLDAPQRFHNTVAVRAGLEYRAGAWTWRGGAYRDPSPQPASSVSPILSDAARTGFTLGAGRAWGRWRVDAYALLLLFERSSTEGVSADHFEGTYHPRAAVVGASMGWKR